MPSTISVTSFHAASSESYSRLGEAHLLRLIHDGDRTAAEEMVDRTYSTIFASLLKLSGDRDLAADLTQETYQRAWEAIGDFEGRSKITTWLYRIAYTTFLNHVRRPKRIAALDEETSARFSDPRPPADELLAQAEESNQLRKAILDLPEDLQFTVTARFWGELPVREIARIEKVTTVAIRKRLYKAFSILEASIGGETP
ncbi:MAG TPA: RNA polymerase sigma factor [Thermoanaerobaculia bacterium]|nr:RNA polymerase sigma factor [Thermoanaerobaculia bacterium]